MGSQISILILTLLIGCASTKISRKDCEEKVRLSLIAAYPKPETTVTYRDTTIYVPGKETIITLPVDTVWKTKIQDRIKLIYRTIHDTIDLTVKCPDDSIPLKIPEKNTTHIINPKVFEEIKNDEQNTQFVPNWGLWLGGCIIIFGILFYVLRFVFSYLN